MNKLLSDPLTQNDAQLIFKLLDIITAEIHRLFAAGMTLDESVSGYEADKILNKIDRKQQDIQRLRQLLAKTRQYIARRKAFDKQRQKR